MIKESVFIIEDEERIVDLLRDYLLKSGYEVFTEKKGDNAVEKILLEKPDLILLDIMLPGKDGITILKELREFSDIPVIMITARIDEIDRLIGLNSGAGYMVVCFLG